MSGYESMGAYAERLRDDPEERKSLVDDLFIDVTHFFRDPEAFLLIESEVMPKLAEAAAAEDRPIRIWVPGCATGEEAYSLIMLAVEAAERAGVPGPGVQAFATDVHQRALDAAGAGVYTDEQLAKVALDRRERFFTRTGDSWQVRPEIRSMLTLAKHNLLTDTPFTRVDLVSCRNLLIYFKIPAQELAIASMGFALRNDGILFLGSSETLGFAASDYDTISGTWRIHRKISNRAQQDYRRNPPTRTSVAVAQGRPAERATTDLAVLRAYDAILSEQFAAGLLISDRREVTYVLGGASEWLRHSPGRPSKDVLTLVEDPNLRLIIGAALRQLESGSDIADPRPLGSLYTNESGESLVLVGKRLKIGANRHSFLLYVAPTVAPIEIPMLRTPSLTDSDDETAFLAIEAELRHTRESLQGALEEQETSNEELNAANEELIASNEELQSTNEELSSVNEELRTLNDEHQRRLDQVLELTADLEQLMSSTEIAVVFLAEDRTVRRFNEPARDYFRVRDNDLGRPFDDIVNTLTYDELVDDVANAFEHGKKSSRAVRNTASPDQRLIAQVSNYELARNRSGVLIAIVNITEIELADEQRLLAACLEGLPLPFMVWDAQGGIKWGNSSSAEWLEAESAEALAGTNSSDWGTEDEQHRRMNDIFTVLRTGQPLSGTTQSSKGKIRLTRYFPFRYDGVTHIGYRNVPLGEMLHTDVRTHFRADGTGLRGINNEVIIHLDNDGPMPEGPEYEQMPSSWTEEGLRASSFEPEPHLLALSQAREGEVVHLRERLSIDGVPRWHAFRYAPITEDPLGESHPEGTVILSTFDIDDVAEEVNQQRHRVAELETTIIDLEMSAGADVASLAERNEDLDNFAHVAAHDLKAPVRSIRSFAEIALAEIEESSPAVPHIEKVIDSSQRMGQLIDSLLDFASIGRDAYEPEAVDLVRVLDDITVDLRSSITDSQAEVMIDLRETALTGSTDGVRQVLANLVQNSLKFSGANGPPKITVSSEEADGGLLVSVIDNGIGFPTEEAGRLFEPFQRLHGTQEPGSGVGLAICRRIVQRHGGRIWASSEPGRGSTFSFWIPR